MFGRIRSFFSRSPRTRTVFVPMRLPIRGKYDAAQTTEDNRRHWAMADALSAAAANSRTVRRTVRNRARYEYANNCYCKGIVDTLANDVVGSGPRPQLNIADKAAAKRIAQIWREWAAEINLAGKFRTMRKSKGVDGEAFALFITNDKLKSPIKLDLKLIEADQVSDPNDSQNNADGIKFDENGSPVSYTILNQHPGDGLSQTKALPPIPAALMLHWFSADRPGQVRGIPEIMPALPLFANLRRFTLATIAAAETAADFAAIMYSTATADDGADEVESFVPIEIEQRAMLTIPQGWQMSQLKAEHPSTTYAEFKKECLNEIARCLSVPYNIAACNSSGYNYSSGRLDHQTYFKSLLVQREEAEIVLLKKILGAWLEEAALVPGLLPAGPYGDWSGDVDWFWDGQEHVDPTKEADAQETRLRNHTTTLADEYAKEGHDWEPKLRQRAVEVALMKELGLLTEASAAPAANPPAKDDESEDDPTDQDETDAETIEEGAAA